jgi:serpin B
MKKLLLTMIAVLTVVGLQAQEEPKRISLTQDERKMVNGSNGFALDLFRKARTDKDMILSPLSITYALGMLNNGAAGETQEEINKVLGFGDFGAKGINDFCLKMLREAVSLDKQTKVMISNTIFVNQTGGYALKPDFVGTAKDCYQAEPECRDFFDGRTLDVINQWGNDHTEGMIPKILSEDEFDPTYVSYLLNAIYFKGIWMLKFDEKETKDETFDHGGAEKRLLTLPMMHQEKQLYYMEDDNWQVLKLPYGNGAYRMTLLLPQPGKELEKEIQNLTVENWEKYQWNREEAIVDVKLPRFESNTSIDLKGVMSALGMPKAFTPEAEFPNFCNVPTYIGLMKQVARIKVNEEGTEAAAITIIGEKATSVGSEPKHVKFHANRPFLYIISEESTGAIFFMGQFMGNTRESKGESTDIREPETKNRTTEDNSLYNLSGQRLSNPPARGVYIQNGKKALK